ncbi:hypothetical protein PS662_04367 [Pseudomonas fluorescens]|uniref:Uncharacterized protein n=1 Tax=Pseudomonas fluorescens TaxID=294 RepID=A0A5E6VYR2_PSEFL|nr:hypothetical protein [Pseudomonas fluorescens]VVN21016.1 hypothetical protein PS662_04367 [Pseudomonas fluorescens]
MKILLIVLMLLTGCAQKETIQEPPKVQRTTVYRYTSGQCIPADNQGAALRQALKSRDEWKRYAESLEQLPAAKKVHDLNP